MTVKVGPYFLVIRGLRGVVRTGRADLKRCQMGKKMRENSVRASESVETIAIMKLQIMREKKISCSLLMRLTKQKQLVAVLYPKLKYSSRTRD